jgi:hypothetical protein
MSIVKALFKVEFDNNLKITRTTSYGECIPIRITETDLKYALVSIGQALII